MSWPSPTDDAWRRISWLSPLALRFTHAEISAEFQNGNKLDETIDQFYTQSLSAQDFLQAPLEVVCKDGALWSLNNRRLYVFRVAHALGCCTLCPCYIVPQEHPSVDRILNRWNDALTSTTNGKLVNVRGGSRHQEFQTGHPINAQAAASLQLPSIEQFLHRAKMTMGCTQAEMRSYQELLAKEGFTTLCSLFDLAYCAASELGLPNRLHRCLCQLLSSAEPFDSIREEQGVVQGAHGSGADSWTTDEQANWSHQSWREKSDTGRFVSQHGWGDETQWQSSGHSTWQQPHSRWQTSEHATWQTTGSSWEMPRRSTQATSSSNSTWQTPSENSGWQPHEHWPCQMPPYPTEQPATHSTWQTSEHSEWRHQENDWSWQMPAHTTERPAANTTYSTRQTSEQSRWQSQVDFARQMPQRPTCQAATHSEQLWEHSTWKSQGQSSWQVLGTPSVGAPEKLSSQTQMPRPLGENSGVNVESAQEAVDPAVAREFVESFCRRRELTKPAKRDLLNLDVMLAFDIVKALEVDKKDLSLQPAEWSKIVGSRVAARAAAGELDQSLLQRIEWLIAEVVRASILSQKVISELRSTLRSLPAPELEDVLRDNNFTQRVPFGTINNPAAYAHRIADRARKRRVETMIPDYIARWRYSRHTEQALRELCRANPMGTLRLMENHKASRGEASLLRDIQATEQRGRSYVSRTPCRSAHENHKQLESEWSDEETPERPCEVWSNWRPSDLPRVEVRAGKDDTCGAEGREQKGGDAGKAASVPQINHKLAVVPESSVGEAELEADVTGNETEHSAVQPSGGAEPQDEGDPFEDGSDSDDSDDSLPPMEVISTQVAMAPPKTQVAVHFVIVLDISGSMSSCDCYSHEGKRQRRIDAVQETLSELACDIEKGQQKYLPTTSCGDVYSFVTFSTWHRVEFRLQNATAAAEQLQRRCIDPDGQTSYTAGLEGLESCVKEAELRSDTKGRPTYALFLSDGETWDADQFLGKLGSLKQSLSSTIRINAVAFGNSDEHGNDFQCCLQQLAVLGGGKFTPASNSVASLRAAFRTVRSTITTSRRKDSVEVSSRRAASLDGPKPDEAEVDNKLQRVEVSDEAGSWRSAHVIKMNTDQTCEVRLSDGATMCVPFGRVWWPSTGAELEVESAQPRMVQSYLKTWEGWEDFKTARRYRYRFDGKCFHVDEVVETRVCRRVKFFSKGQMRIVRFMIDESMGKDLLLVCKHLLVPQRTANGKLEIRPSTKAEMEQFCRNSAVAAHFAKRFRTKHGYESLGFTKDALYELHDASGDAQIFIGERYMEGAYVKFNNNGGSVNKEDHRHHCEIAQAFSHFSFDESHKELLVVDLQGVPATTQDGQHKLYLTDPQVHCRYGNYESFGEGDLKAEGVKKFFQTHSCNGICKKLNLRQLCEYNEVPPRAVVTFPGLSTDFLRELTKGTLQRVRKQFGLTEVVFPNEVIGPQLEVKLWGRWRQTSLAKEAIERSVKDLLDKHCAWLPLLGTR